MKELTSSTWESAGNLLRKSKLSMLTVGAKDEACWDEAFDLVVLAISEERENDPDFAREITDLDEATDYKYNLQEALELYFDHLEYEEKWEEVIYSCNRLFEAFDFKKVRPSQYMFRKGNALEALGRYEDALKFGQKWLEDYPDDLYAAAANTYLLVSLERYEEATAITEKYLGQELRCDDETDTFFMAAYRLYELTEDINARQRVEKKISDYNRIIAERRNKK